MVTTIISSLAVSTLVVGTAVAGCLIFAVIMVLTDERKGSALAVLNRSLIAFIIPLLVLFTYLAVVLGTTLLLD